LPALGQRYRHWYGHGPDASIFNHVTHQLELIPGGLLVVGHSARAGVNVRLPLRRATQSIADAFSALV